MRQENTHVGEHQSWNLFSQFTYKSSITLDSRSLTSQILGTFLSNFPVQKDETRNGETRNSLKLLKIKGQASKYFSHLSSSPTRLFRPYSLAQRLTACANTGATCSKCCSICVIFRVAPLTHEKEERSGKVTGNGFRKKAEEQELTEHAVTVNQSCCKQMCHSLPCDPVPLKADTWILQDTVAAPRHQATPTEDRQQTSLSQLAKTSF